MSCSTALSWRWRRLPRATVFWPQPLVVRSDQRFARDRLLGLLEASQAILSGLDLKDVFQRIAQRAAAVLDAECASVQLFDAERRQLVFQTSVGPGSEHLVGRRFDATLGIAGQVIQTRRAVRVDDVAENRNFFDGIDGVTQIPVNEEKGNTFTIDAAYVDERVKSLAKDEDLSRFIL